MSNLSIKFKIITPERVVFEGDVDQVTLPTTMGQITILPNHRSYISSIMPGELMTRNDKEEKYLFVSGGFIEFNNNELIVLADTAERAEEIDLRKAEEARKRAEEIRENTITMDEEEYASVAAAIQRESARIRVAKKHYTRRGMNLE
jgi:F-type H+-transporting ATPase subunit epsilon